MDKVRISKNFNTYIIKEVPEGFWEKWRKNKDIIRERGISPFKVNGEYYLAVYNGKSVSENEYIAQQNEYIQEVKDELSVYFNNFSDYFTKDELENINSIILTKNSLEELSALEDYSDNYKFLLEQIEENIIKKIITK